MEHCTDHSFDRLRKWFHPTVWQSPPICPAFSIAFKVQTGRIIMGKKALPSSHPQLPRRRQQTTHHHSGAHYLLFTHLLSILWACQAGSTIQLGVGQCGSVSDSLWSTPNSYPLSTLHPQGIGRKHSKPGGSIRPPFVCRHFVPTYIPIAFPSLPIRVMTLVTGEWLVLLLHR